ncbi:MAG TPA: DUF1440 domain-containing protein [Tepidisphaeraceae bacterium]|nr:DUF1440 domain-containing protein [Tepidisphaeraceae bacterium]
MKKEQSRSVRCSAIGLAAGLAGTAAMMVMRMFDQKYAPRTVPKTETDPGESVMHAAKDAIGALATIPKPVEHAVAMTAPFAYGAAFGALYGLVRRHSKHRSALADGIVLGSVVYAAGYLGWLPTVGLTKPVWKQELPEIAGEVLRHVAYGVATAATYGMIDATI